MRAVDIVARYIEDQGMTQSEAAEVVGWSRQNFWDKLNNRNPRFNTMIHIFNSFGFTVRITRSDGSPPDFDEKAVFDLASAKNIYFDTLEDFINAMGYKFDIKRPD